MDISTKILSDVTVYMKYAKYLPEQERRETWAELVDRNKAMHTEKYPHLSEEIEEVYQMVLDKKVLPSMRSMQFAGKAIDISPNRIYNCFAESEQFITSAGLRSFADFSDGDRTEVLTHTGEWKSAVVRSYGVQSLNEVTFVRGRSKKVVRVTGNHRWIKYDGTETTNLSVGDVTYPTKRTENFSYYDADPIARLYWCYGYVYGDGTRLKDSHGVYKYSGVRLCGADKNMYLDRFEEMGFKTSTSTSLNGDVMVYTGHYLKTTPDLDKDPLPLIRAFVDGYLAADGYKNPDWYANNSLSKYKGIQASDADHVEFLDRALDMCGYYITSRLDRSGVKTNLGVYQDGTTYFGITTQIGSRKNTSWSVKSIVEDVAQEEVWCLEVEGDRSFVLSGGLVTGNCAYLPLDDWRAFSEAMFLLLGGTGVGYSVQKHHVDKLPELRMPNPKRTRRFLIDDSIQGWADAVKVLLKSYFHGGSKIRFDFSDIRPKGARLVTSGGKAPGPQPLKECLVRIQGVLDNKKAGDKLSPIEVHDIVCYIADSVLAGGIRRAALISLFSADDDDMLAAKSGAWWEKNPQRGRANNSAVLMRHRITKEFFMDVWKRVEMSGAGEPGIYLSNDKDWGTNPSLRKGTRIWTTEGVVPIEDLEDKIFYVRNLDGQISKAKCWLSGRGKRLYKLTLTGGHEYYATAEHEWPVWDGEKYIKVRTPDINSGDLLKFQQTDRITDGTQGSYDAGFFAGWHLGDGWTSEKSDGMLVQGLIVSQQDVALGIHTRLQSFLRDSLGSEATFRPRASHSCLELSTTSTAWNDFQLKYGYGRKELGLPKAVWTSASEDFRRGLIDGLFSSDGSVEKGKKRVCFHTSHEALAQDVSDLLGLYGVKHSKRFRENSGKGCYVIDILGNAAILRFKELFTLTHTHKQARIDAYEFPYILQRPTNQIEAVSVEKTDLHEDVWDITVYDATHAFQLPHVVTGNCCEIALRPYQFCNLTEVNVSNIESQEDLNSRVKAAAFLATLQAGYTDFHYLRPIWKRTTEKDALIGVSMTGIGSGVVLDYDMTEAANIVKDENARIAESIGIKPAARTTCVKPAGTTSLTLGTSSGIHAWHNDYYIRRIRVGKNEAIYTYLAINHPELVEDEAFRPHDTAVISIPQKAPEGAIMRTESSFDLLERVKKVSQEWIAPGHRSGNNTHNVSATVSIKDGDWDAVGEWMWENRSSYNGLSVLPYSDHTYLQSPFEDCTKEEYERLMKTLVDVDLSKIIELTDETDLRGELACSGQSCEVS